MAPLPEAFGQVFGFWLKDPLRGEYLFARAPGQKPVFAQEARASLRGMLKQAGIDKKISPHKLRHTDATHRLDAGAERVDLQALLGHESVAIPPMDTHGGPERMEQGVARLRAEEDRYPQPSSDLIPVQPMPRGNSSGLRNATCTHLSKV